MYVYLASPYSAPTPEEENTRYWATVDWVAFRLRINPDFVIFSPIVHSHPMTRRHSFPGSIEFWRNHCIRMLTPAKELWVLQLPGWEDSKGVKEEIELAFSMEKPILYWEI